MTLVRYLCHGHDVRRAASWPFKSERARVLAAAAVGILGALPFCAIGLFFGVRTTSRSAPAFVNIMYQIMMHVSACQAKAERSLMSPFWSPALWFLPCSQSAASLRRAEEGTQESRAVVSAPAGDPI